MSELDSVVQEFLVESHENLDQLDRDLVALEKAPDDREKLASIFRTIHTIKGTCGFLGYDRLGALTHAGEGLLSRLRDGKLRLDPKRTSALLALVDAVRAMLARIEASGTEGDNDHAALIAHITQLHTAEPAPVGQSVPQPTVDGAGPSAGVAGQEAPEPGLGGGVAESTIRVDVGLLDRLMTLVGELVLVRNQILQSTGPREGADFLNSAQRLDRITTDLQEGVMKTRMQPIGTVGKTLPRLVRDVALACGKNVRLDLEGEETEVDRTVLEAIKGPLTHLVRNAVDHGIEAPEVRAARGKPAEGRLLLRAYHAGGQVHIEARDDGGGIDGARVREKALARGLISAEQAERQSEQELLQLVFAPGFSTAERVTSVSGRGVGMDVVKTNIERIGGTVELESWPGHGTAVKIKVPLTLAIVPALLVTSGGERFAIPQVNLIELVRLDGELARQSIEDFHGALVYRLRGSLLPLVHLHRELRLAPPPGDSAVHIVVLEADGRPFGLIVEGVNDTEEIVVKPLSKLLKGATHFAGSTILGDGKVALILDTLGVARAAGLVSEARNRPAEPPALSAASLTAPPRRPLLVVVGEKGRRLAVPLETVDRLEEVASSAVEWAGGREVVQQRGRLLPLVRLAGRQEGPLQVVVCAAGGRSVGLVVEAVLDILEGAAEVERVGTCGDPGSRHRRDRRVRRPGRGWRGEHNMTGPQQVCTFSVGGLLLGVEVSHVQEVLCRREMTRVPLAPPSIRGLLNLRGQIVPAIDLRVCLELPPCDGEGLLNVVVRSDGAAVSLLVDKIGDVLQAAAGAFEAPPETLVGPRRRLIRGAYKLEGRLLFLLDVDSALARAAEAAAPGSPEAPRPGN